MAILGEVASGRSLEAAPICQKNGIPQISPSSTNPKVTEVGKYIFRICFIDPFQGAVLAKFAHASLHAKRVALLVSEGHYFVLTVSCHSEGATAAPSIVVPALSAARMPCLSSFGDCGFQ